MNICLGGIFYLWVRQFEPGGHANALPRPAGVEGWLPIAGMMNLKYFILTHHIPTLHPAAMFLLVTFASIAFLSEKHSAAGFARLAQFLNISGKWARKFCGETFGLRAGSTFRCGD